MVYIARTISVLAWLGAALVYFTGGPDMLDSFSHTLFALCIAAVAYCLWVPSERPRSR